MFKTTEHNILTG